MITVCIYINDRPIAMRSAVNVRWDEKNDISTYKIYETGKKIKHKRSDGAVALAKKLLDTVHLTDGH